MSENDGDLVFVSFIVISSWIDWILLLLWKEHILVLDYLQVQFITNLTAIFLLFYNDI